MDTSPAPSTVVKVDPHVGPIVEHRLGTGEIIRSVFDSGIRASIEKAVASLPPGEPFVVVGHADLTGAATGSVVAQTRDHKWTFVGVVNHKPDTKWTGEAAVVWRPFARS